MELLERDHELQQLSDALHLAKGGLGRIALVSGEAGIGKTSLVQQFLISISGVRILLGGCEALYSPRPFGPMHDMADGLGPELIDLLARDGQRANFFNALLANLKGASECTVMVLEDMHWADAATLDLVKFLARRIQRVSVLFVLTFRNDELDRSHPLRGVLGDLPPEAVMRIPMNPLSEAGVVALALKSQRSPAGLFQVTNGNPFFVTEAIRSEGVPESIRDAVLARANRLPSAARNLVELTSVVPARIEAEIVADILAPDQDDLSAALFSGLLISDGRSYAFRHELARIAILQTLAAPFAASLHAKVLLYLVRAQVKVPMARLVHHASGANDSEAVLQFAPLAAAEAASSGTNREAARLFGIALQNSGAVDVLTRAHLLERRAYYCYLTDQMDEAIAAHRATLAIWRSEGNALREGYALRWLSRYFSCIGQRTNAEKYADDALQVLNSFPDSREYGWAMSNRAQLSMNLEKTDDALVWGQRAIDLATRLGDQEILSHALNSVGTVTSLCGRQAGRAMLERSLAIAHEHGYRELIARAYSNLTFTAIEARDYAYAQHTLTESFAYFDGQEFDSWYYFNVGRDARLKFEQGLWDQAAELAGSIAKRQEVAVTSRISSQAILARIRMLRGDPGGTDLLLEAKELARPTGELMQIAPVAIALAEAHWLKMVGVHDDEFLLQAIDLSKQCQDARLHGELLFWARQIGLAVADSDLMEQPYLYQFHAQWREAADFWGILGCPYDKALALLGGDENGVVEALQILETLGASAAVKCCREKLHQSGVRGIARGPRKTTSNNFSGLTNRELEILLLLAEGLTNADIAARLVRSEKTVDHHISAILSKLKVRSRVEAAALVSRLGMR